VTFNEKLTALGGKSTREVEVYDGANWDNQIIQSIGNKYGKLDHFTSLASNSQLYVFGNIFVDYSRDP